VIFWLLFVPLRVVGAVSYYAGLFAGLLWLQWARGGGMLR
jgi:hypothetical protein